MRVLSSSNKGSPTVSSAPRFPTAIVAATHAQLEEKIEKKACAHDLDSLRPRVQRQPKRRSVATTQSASNPIAVDTLRPVYPSLLLSCLSQYPLDFTGNSNTFSSTICDDNMTQGTDESMPLHGTWTLFYDNPRLAPEGTSWADNLKTCGDFDNADDFWRIFNNVKPASQMATNSNYHLFRQGIQPMWEDPANVNGGKFVLTIPKKDSKNGRCDEWWLYTVLAMIGETMDLHGDQVAGAVVSIRKSQDRIALWLKSSDPNICIPIGERWKKALEFNKTPLKYQFHKDGTKTWISMECCGDCMCMQYSNSSLSILLSAAASGSSFKNEIKFEV